MLISKKKAEQDWPGAIVFCHEEHELQFYNVKVTLCPDLNALANGETLTIARRKIIVKTTKIDPKTIAPVKYSVFIKVQKDVTSKVVESAVDTLNEEILELFETCTEPSLAYEAMVDKYRSKIPKMGKLTPSGSGYTSLRRSKPLDVEQDATDDTIARDPWKRVKGGKRAETPPPPPPAKRRRAQMGPKTPPTLDPAAAQRVLTPISRASRPQKSSNSSPTAVVDGNASMVLTDNDEMNLDVTKASTISEKLDILLEYNLHHMKTHQTVNGLVDRIKKMQADNHVLKKQVDMTQGYVTEMVGFLQPMYRASRMMTIPKFDPLPFDNNAEIMKQFEDNEGLEERRRWLAITLAVSLNDTNSKTMATSLIDALFTDRYLANHYWSFRSVKNRRPEMDEVPPICREWFKTVVARMQDEKPRFFVPDKFWKTVRNKFTDTRSNVKSGKLIAGHKIELLASGRRQTGAAKQAKKTTVEEMEHHSDNETWSDSNPEGENAEEEEKQPDEILE